MLHPQDYVLIIGQMPGDLQNNEIIRCPMVIADSPEMAIATAQANPPYLVILSGENSQTWSSPRVAQQIRQSVQPEAIVIVSLNESSDLIWEPQIGSPEIDGFFVTPMSTDVLSSLNESAMAKQKCLQPA